MSNRPCVHHPNDPTEIPFDFYAWRVARRLEASRLRALATVRPEALSYAEAIETETLDCVGLEALQALLAAEQEAPVSTNDELFLALDRILERHSLRPKDEWQLPVIQPDWNSMSVSRAVFVGTVDGLRLSARLENKSRPVPDPVIVWLQPDGTESEPQSLNASIGRYLTLAPAIWDWLVARRLTLLCAAGVLPWPVEPPLIIEAVNVPGRGF